MAVFYNKERAKYGHLTGQVIAWPVPYEGTPDIANNKKSLPAGYLKCDGTKYFEKDYPRLAEICGTGSSCKFVRKNLDGTDFDTLNLTSTTSNTISADIDTQQLALSVGYRF